ncbi:unnamed protein product [Ixodes hexagonus]
MHFTMASIWEILRWKNVVPVKNPRGAAENTFIGEYYIPKSSVVLANAMAVQRDPQFWEHPDEFDPTRFLKKDVNELAKTPEQLLPFSLGKMCPGERMAYVELFLYITTVLQKFTVFPEGGKLPPSLGSLDVVITEKSVRKLRFVVR